MVPSVIGILVVVEKRAVLYCSKTEILERQ